MSDELLEKLIAINDEKITKIIPENVKSGITAFGVQGAVVELKGETKIITPTTSQQIITPSTGKNGVTEITVEAVTNAIDNNIVAENIKKDVSILGVTGTYEGSVNEIKEFNSIASMQADQTATENDLAMVYNNGYLGSYQYQNTNLSSYNKPTAYNTMTLGSYVDMYTTNNLLIADAASWTSLPSNSDKVDFKGLVLFEDGFVNNIPNTVTIFHNITKILLRSGGAYACVGIFDTQNEANQAIQGAVVRNPLGDYGYIYVYYAWPNSGGSGDDAFTPVVEQITINGASKWIAYLADELWEYRSNCYFTGYNFKTGGGEIVNIEILDTDGNNYTLTPEKAPSASAIYHWNELYH